jgi:NlpC/P60 family putative phage cell wall peptidase
MTGIALAAAREMLGTPYHLGASLPGVGCDCVGLIEHVVRSVRGITLPPRPGAPADWARTGDALEAAARHWLHPVPMALAAEGDVVILQMPCPRGLSRPLAPSHCGVVSGVWEGRITHVIHAMDATMIRAVSERRLGPGWDLVSLWRV